jgi:hypothetical protein
MADDKVLLCQLWERTSAKGTVYLSGFLGKARLVGFKGEQRADGTRIWDIYLPGRDQQAVQAPARDNDRSPAAAG